MSRRSRRTWLVVALIGLLGLALLAHLTGGEIATTLREMHAPR